MDQSVVIVDTLNNVLNCNYVDNSCEGMEELNGTKATLTTVANELYAITSFDSDTVLYQWKQTEWIRILEGSNWNWVELNSTLIVLGASGTMSICSGSTVEHVMTWTGSCWKPAEIPPLNNTSITIHRLLSDNISTFALVADNQDVYWWVESQCYNISDRLDDCCFGEGMIVSEGAVIFDGNLILSCVLVTGPIKLMIFNSTTGSCELLESLGSCTSLYTWMTKSNGTLWVICFESRSPLELVLTQCDLTTKQQTHNSSSATELIAPAIDVYSMIGFGSNLFVAGYIALVDGVATPYGSAVWNGTDWTPTNITLMYSSPVSGSSRNHSQLVICMADGVTYCTEDIQIIDLPNLGQLLVQDVGITDSGEVVAVVEEFPNDPERRRGGISVFNGTQWTTHMWDIVYECMG